MTPRLLRTSSQVSSRPASCETPKTPKTPSASPSATSGTAAPGVAWPMEAAPRVSSEDGIPEPSAPLPVLLGRTKLGSAMGAGPRTGFEEQREPAEVYSGPLPVLLGRTRPGSAPGMLLSRSQPGAARRAEALDTEATNICASEEADAQALACAARDTYLARRLRATRRLSQDVPHRRW
eukprot:CAMPEP_0175327672 /NCGR_PEP_ID=MMETSP0093-20121207/75165_1 /TAXON_ID=311494 /ORGANISM="Alexandrium monilatum, Strain CCMP3105" /LENGTH=178 /DNA_ID=CAMNT_0016624707 /DNA_START=103 /DNA_END=636 /DNA_ORIENTATION=+